MIAERFSGNRKIIESDTVYLYRQDDDLTLSFMFKEKDFDIIIRRTYVDGAETNIMNLIVCGQCLYLEPLERMPDGSIGTVRPVKIAEVGEKKIYMHAWNYRVSDTVRKIEYTVYSADE